MRGKYLLLLPIIFLLAVTLNAQEDAPYLKGAITEVNGKIVFNRVIESNPKLSDSQLFEKINLWAEAKYNLNNGTDNRVLLSDVSKKQIACAGETNIVFGRKLLSVDMASMDYQLVLKVENGNCDATIRGISYGYSNGRDIEKLLAEDMITDKMAVNKKGDKLANYYGKFRKTTIDSVNAIFRSLDEYMNGIHAKKEIQIVYIDKNTGQEVNAPEPAIIAATPIVQTATPVTETVATPVNETTGAFLAGYKHIQASNIPENYIKLLDEWTLVTSGKGDNVNVMTASWGGLGMFWSKPVTFLFLNPTRYSIKTMDEGDTYTISFYSPAYKDVLKYCGSKSGRDTDKIKGSGLTPIKTPSGATAFSEAWMIIECRKMIAQPLSEAAVKLDQSELDSEWTKNGLHKMYMGEILNIWVK